jgi:hypothetical protein
VPGLQENGDMGKASALHHPYPQIKTPKQQDGQHRYDDPPNDPFGSLHFLMVVCSHPIREAFEHTNLLKCRMKTGQYDRKTDLPQ